jgi:hypothetical protein
MPAKYVRPYSKGQKNDFRDAEAIAEAVQRPNNATVNFRRQYAYSIISSAALVRIGGMVRVPNAEWHDCLLSTSRRSTMIVCGFKWSGQRGGRFR